MKVELDNYITKNYYQLLAISKKYTKNDDWSKELLHTVIVQLYDKKEWNISLDDESIKAYIIRALMVNWCFPSSPFYRKNKSFGMQDIDIKEVLNIVDQESEMKHHQLMETLEMEYSELDFFNKNLFNKYLVLGSLKKVSNDTSIPLRSVSRYITETKEIVKQNIFKKLK